jgi:adenosyl cobinamide kinase/adenosyl cobinamide phosphate guanylyltransferase
MSILIIEKTEGAIRNEQSRKTGNILHEPDEKNRVLLLLLLSTWFNNDILFTNKTKKQTKNKKEEKKHIIMRYKSTLFLKYKFK